MVLECRVSFVDKASLEIKGMRMCFDFDLFEKSYMKIKIIMNDDENAVSL